MENEGQAPGFRARLLQTLGHETVPSESGAHPEFVRVENQWVERVAAWLATRSGNFPLPPSWLALIPITPHGLRAAVEAAFPIGEPETAPEPEAAPEPVTEVVPEPETAPEPATLTLPEVPDRPRGNGKKAKPVTGTPEPSPPGDEASGAPAPMTETGE